MVHSSTIFFQAKLLATQQERDMALAKIRKQEDELQNLRVYYRYVSMITIFGQDSMFCPACRVGISPLDNIYQYRQN